MSQKNRRIRLGRRDFLKAAAIATGAVALPVSYEILTSTEDRAKAASARTQTDTYNGWRGQNFSSGWRFNRGDVSGGQNPSYNDSGWRSLNLPHDWSIELAFNQSSPAGSNGGYLDGGVGWYRKTFTVPAEYSGRKVFIGFDGVYMNSQVWINGNLLGTRPYGYISFEYDISPYLNYGGSNVIAVRVNNNQPNSRWYSGSGIYRNVWLTVLSQTHVDYCGMFVSTPNVSSGSATVNVSTKVVNQSGSTQSVTLLTTILDANGNTVTTNTSSAVNINAGGNSTFSQNLTVANPQLWSPNSPYLYTARTQVRIGGSVVDTYQSTCGIRYFAFDANNGFSLNGVRMKINGVCNHHDLGSLGAAVNYRAIERQLQILKAMGCNAIRMAHNPPDPMVLEVCDRLGFMAMDEVFDCWETGKTNNDYHLYFNSWAQQDLQAMVVRDRNHPSIIIWNIGNEVPSPTAATATRLKNWVKAIDTTRPVSCAMFAVAMGEAASIAVADVLDIVGYNYFPYMYDSGHSGHPAWKMFGSETASALRSRGVYKTPTNQNILTGSDNQCSSYDNSWPSWGNPAESSYTEINRRTWMAGEFVWTGFDYIGEPTPYTWPSKSSYFGMVDTCGFPKDIYYFYQSRWTTAPMVHILPHWNWSGGQTIPVWVYSNCDSVELFLNNVSLGTRTFSGGVLHLTWDVPFSAGTLRAEGRRSGSIVATKEMRTAGAASRLAVSVDRSRIAADGEDLAFVTVDVVDSSGVLVPNASNTVNFSISGPGVIAGVDNGNAPSTESYKGTSRQAFSGKCLAIVRSTGGAGAITLTASSSGLSSGSVSITAEGGVIATDTPTPTLTATLPPGNNLAQGKPATASSAEANNPAANGNDGSSATRWCAANGNAGAWWQVDLGASTSLSGSEVVWEFGGRLYQYRVEVSGNGSTWTTVVDKTNNTSTAQTQTNPFSATGRYVRITVTGLPTDPITWASFFELRVFGSGVTITPTATLTPTATATPTATLPPGNNLAQGKPATASSAETNNPAANGNDGNSATRWCAANGNTGAWWQVDLGASTSLSGSEVVWEFGGRLYRYRVEVSGNGSIWTTVVDKTNNTSTAQTQTDPFSAMGRYVRITVTGLPTDPITWASFFELRVFGAGQVTNTPTPTPTATTPPSGELLANGNAESGTSGWGVFGAGTLAANTSVVHGGAQSLLLTGRTGSWNGISQDITSKLTSGRSYTTNVWMRTQSGTPTAKVTLAVTANGSTSYISLAQGAVNSSGWTLLSGTATVSWTGTLSSATFYVETTSGTDSFYIDDASFR